MRESHTIEVRCYSGCNYNERPVSFTIGEKTLAITELIDQWHGAGYTYYKLIADDGNTYCIKYNGSTDTWELNFFQDRRLERNSCLSIHGPALEWEKRAQARPHRNKTSKT
jgi:hypothetical protein